MKRMKRKYLSKEVARARGARNARGPGRTQRRAARADQLGRTGDRKMSTGRTSTARSTGSGTAR